MKYNPAHIDDTYFIEAPRGACGNFIQALVHKMLYGNECFDNTIGAYGHLHNITGVCPHIEHWMESKLTGNLEPADCTFTIVKAHHFDDIHKIQPKHFISVLVDKEDFIQIKLFDLIKFFGMYLNKEQVVHNRVKGNELDFFENKHFNKNLKSFQYEITRVTKKKCPKKITNDVIKDYFKSLESILDEEWQTYFTQIRRDESTIIHFRDIWTSQDKVLSQLQATNEHAQELYRNYINKNCDIVNSNFNWLDPITGERSWN